MAYNYNSTDFFFFVGVCKSAVWAGLGGHGWSLLTRQELGLRSSPRAGLAMSPGLPHSVVASSRYKHPEHREKPRWRLWLLTTKPQKAAASFLTTLLTEAATGAHPVSKGGDEAPSMAAWRVARFWKHMGDRKYWVGHFKNNFMYLLIFGCAGSSLLLGFSLAAMSGATL